MPAANVPLVIDQGEDFTAQIVWTDEYDRGQAMTAPMRLDIVGAGNSPIISLTTPDLPLPEGEVAEISYSTEIGLIQLHIDRGQTAALNPGVYRYDLFVSVENPLIGTQQVRLLAGQVVVNQRITVM